MLCQSKAYWPVGAFVAVAANLLLNVHLALGQLSPNFQREAPAPLTDADFAPTVEAEMFVDPSGRTLYTIPGFPNISTAFVGRAATIFDTTRLADFAAGTFMPSAIPVEGEPFFEFGERAMLQGNGSAVKISAQPVVAGNNVYAEALFVVEELSTSELDSFRLSSRAYLQYNQLVVGVTETAFADPDATVPIFDLAGPNATATVLSPIGGSGQGRLSYYLYPSGSGERGLIGNVSIEMPTPEIRFTSGTTIPTTFSTFSHVPDFITTLRYGDGETIKVDETSTKYQELWHVQVGSVFRDIGLKNGDKSIDDSTLGWGVQVSGATRLFTQQQALNSDAIGFSVIAGEGIGHYINDLHVLATGIKTGGNDAVLNGSTVEVLPAHAFYVGYVHSWSDSWQSSAGYSHVNLDPVPGQADKAYRRGDYAVLNLVYHQDLTAEPASIKHFFAGLEYLFGNKETVDGSSGDAHRLMFVVSFSK
jgi:hypothetical protein